MPILQWKMDTKAGSLYLVATEQGLREIRWRKTSSPMAASLSGFGPTLTVLRKCVSQLEEYFAGERREFDLPLDPLGTDFQRRVWRELSRIAYGKTCAYRDIALRIGNEKAVRAVGTANGRNPLNIVVPCHRVIASDRTLGGYSGGLKVKEFLLSLERA